MLSGMYVCMRVYGCASEGRIANIGRSVANETRRERFFERSPFVFGIYVHLCTPSSERYNCITSARRVCLCPFIGTSVSRSPDANLVEPARFRSSRPRDLAAEARPDERHETVFRPPLCRHGSFERSRGNNSRTYCPGQPRICIRSSCKRERAE